MSKITVREKKEYTYISNHLVYPEMVNEYIIKAISTGKHKGLLPLECVKKGKKAELKCVVTGMMSLDLYFSHEEMMTKKRFLGIARQLVKCIINCEKNFGSYDNLNLAKDRVFIVPATGEVYCIFWPVVNCKSSESPISFLKQLPQLARFHADENVTFLETYSSCFEKMDPFSINEFKRVIDEMGGYVDDVQAHQTIGDWAKTTSLKRDSGVQSKVSASDIEYDPVLQARKEGASFINPNKEKETVRVCPTCGARNPANLLFCTNCKGEIYNAWRNVGVVSEKVNEPLLTQRRTGETRRMMSDCFRLGADPNEVDWCISDNYFVSRHHADIVKQNGRYYLTDCGSKNGTYYGGMAIPGGAAVELSDRTSFLLANEEFMISNI